MFCTVKPKEVKRVRVDYTKETHGVEAHGFAIVETTYFPGGSLTCTKSFERDK
jgi:hypothetical protein